MYALTNVMCNHRLVLGFRLTLVIIAQVGVNADDGEKPVKIASKDHPANGPFALADATLPTDGRIERKPITDKWFILRKSVTWSEAMAICENASAHLIVLPKEADAKELVQAIADKITEKFDPIEEYAKQHHNVEFGPDRRYWIGLSDQMFEGEWIWAKFGLELVYDFWYPGQPDHGNGKAKNKAEHCAALWNPGYYQEVRNTHTFNDEPCFRKHYPICGTGTPTY